MAKIAPDKAVIFLHGSGDTGPGVRQWVRQASENRFAKALGNTLLVYPTASARPYSLSGGALSNVWHDRAQLSESAAITDLDGLNASFAQVENEIEILEQKGIPSSSIYLGGFSMGGGLALQYLQRRTSAFRLGGIFCLASFLATQSPVFTPKQPLAVPVYMAHGQNDTLVPAAWGKNTFNKLKDIGYDVSWKEYKGLDHELGGEELEDLAEWLEELMKGAGTGAGAAGADSCREV
ncbi:unnamed protein product [Chrysoparadoxa australica]